MRLHFLDGYYILIYDRSFLCLNHNISDSTHHHNSSVKLGNAKCYTVRGVILIVYGPL